MRGEDLRSGYPAAAASVFAFTYIALPMGMLVQLRQQSEGAFYLLYLLLVVWAGDIFAYFVGKSMGRHLMAPRISPKKTWEGAAASLVASVARRMAVIPLRFAAEFGVVACRIDRAAGRNLWARATGDGTDHPANDGAQHRGTIGRSGGVVDQARGRE